MKFKVRTILSAVALGLALLTATNANATLMVADGGQTVYDSDLNIYWLSNANLAATNTFGVTGISTSGAMTWDTAQTWIAAMNTANYLGYKDWRLPTTLQPDASCQRQSGSASWGFFCNGGEMGHLFYTELDGMAYQSILAISNSDRGLFSNIQTNVYWSGTEAAPYPNDLGAWYFSFNAGGQNYDFKGDRFYAWALHSGQANSVPEPTTAWLAGIGLLIMLGVSRRRLAPS